jgi:Ca2+-binding EF-hand superfamily protein
MQSRGDKSRKNAPMSSISTVSSDAALPAGVSSFQQKLFDGADSDGDGAISQDELQTLLEKNPRLTQAFSSLSSSSDSASTAASVFDQADTDEDGKITSSEFTSALTTAREAAKAQRDEATGAPPEPPAGDFSEMLTQVFADGDTDGDGSLTADDLDAMMQQSPGLARDLASLVDTSTDGTASAADVLSTLDADGDGKITESEFTTAVSTAHQNAMTQRAAGAEGSDSTDSLQTFLQEMLQRLQEQQAAYASDGSLDSTATATASTFQATA